MNETVERHDRVQRLWVVAQEDEQCVGAIADGFVPGLMNSPAPHRFLAVVSFAKLGAATERTYADGRTFIVRPVLTQGETRGESFPTIEGAMSWLSAQKADLLADGWIETGLDPVRDPD